MRGLNRKQVVQISRLSSDESFEGKRRTFVLKTITINAFIDVEI